MKRLLSISLFAFACDGATPPPQPTDTSLPLAGPWEQVVLTPQALAAGSASSTTHQVTGSLILSEHSTSSPNYQVVGNVTLVRP